MQWRKEFFHWYYSSLHRITPQRHKTFSSSRNVLVFLPSKSPLLIPQLEATTVLIFHHRLISLVLELPINDSTWYILFCGILLSFTITSLILMSAPVIHLKFLLSNISFFSYMFQTDHKNTTLHYYYYMSKILTFQYFSKNICQRYWHFKFAMLV